MHIKQKCTLLPEVYVTQCTNTVAKITFNSISEYLSAIRRKHDNRDSGLLNSHTQTQNIKQNKNKKNKHKQYTCILQYDNQTKK
jgi:hypothetical protein